MASNDVLSAILHYKRNIDKISDPPERALKYEDRLLHCINRLYKLPVSVNHLQETGIGKTVNALRKIEGEKGLGDAAKALVAKWKTMVMLEDEAERKQREEVPSGPSEDDIKRIKLIRDAEKSHGKKTDSSIKSSDKHQSDNSKSRSHDEHKNRRSESSESGKDSRKRKYEHEDGKHHSKSGKKRIVENSDESDRGEDNLAQSEKHSPEYAPSKSSSSSSSKVHISSKDNEKSKHKKSSSSHNHETSKYDKKKEHKSSSSSTSHSSSESKNVDKHSSSSSSSSSNSSLSNHEKTDSKKSKSKVNDEDGGIDSQSGASFADALGPMVVKKSKKKSTTQVSSTSPPPCDVVSETTVPKAKKQSSKQIDINRPPADLEPLEPDLIATLPVPTPYYKPSPIYHLPPQEASKRRIQAEEDALNTIMSNKNQRTKVYSGVKGGLTYVPSLYEICCRVLQQHIDALEYTGGIPYALLKPVLDAATPAQLFQFEHFNPYIIVDTDHLWKFHVNKEFRNESRQEFESWRDMYLRCIDEREERYKAVTANIQKSIEKSAPVRKAKLAYIDVAKPPRNVIRKQIKNGTAKPEAARLLGKNDPEAVRVGLPKQPTTKEPASFKIKPRVAPLMQKTLKSIKMTRFKR